MDGWKGETRGALEAKRVGSAERTTRLRCGLTGCGPTKAPPAMPERESIRSCDGDGGGDGVVERRRMLKMSNAEREAGGRPWSCGCAGVTGSCLILAWPVPRKGAIFHGGVTYFSFCKILQRWGRVCPRPSPSLGCPLSSSQESLRRLPWCMREIFENQQEKTPSS